MKIEMISAARISLSGYALPEFDILIIPAKSEDGRTVNECYITHRGYGTLYFMFGCFESIEEAAALAYANVPDYLPAFMREILTEE